MSNPVSRLLRKNTSTPRIVGFILSNFLGLVIILGGWQFYSDARSIWEDEDSFLHSDYLVVNKRITSENTINGKSSTFTPQEYADLESQPWVKRTAPFSIADYKVSAGLQQGGSSLSTSMFFESIPDSYVDVARGQWGWREGVDEVPLIISKDYLTLYNFGFAASAGMPQMSEGLMSGIPLTLRLRNDAGREMTFHGRVAGYSNRLNTILVPQAFMDWSNRELGSGTERQPSRVIVEVSSPGDVAIAKYMDEHNLEIAGDKSASSASFLLKVVVGIVLGIGVVITLLSFFILLLSISLLLEKNRDKLHSLLMLGYDPSTVAAPYRRIIVFASLAAYLLALGGMFIMRSYYRPAIAGMGAEPANPLLTVVIGGVLTLLIIGFNILAVRRKTVAAWRISR